MRKTKINFFLIIIIAVTLLSIALVVMVFNNRIKNIEKKAETPVNKM